MEAKRPTSSPQGRGLIQVYTGDGKGKTTAALGLAVRAVGAGKKVAIVYFDKGGDHYSERAALSARFNDAIDFFGTGLDRIDPETGRFRFGVTDADREEAESGLAVARALFSEARHDLVVLDEVNTTVSLGMLDEDAVLAAIAGKPEHTELVLTGRNAPASFRGIADLVSEMTLVDHYFYRGVPAREGLDF